MTKTQTLIHHPFKIVIMTLFDLPPSPFHSISFIFHQSDISNKPRAKPFISQTYWAIKIILLCSYVVFIFQQRRARDHEAGSYLTESPYLASGGRGHSRGRDQPPRPGKSFEQFGMMIEPALLIDKPTLPVLDTRRANFLLGRAHHIFKLEEGYGL